MANFPPPSLPIITLLLLVLFSTTVSSSPQPQPNCATTPADEHSTLRLAHAYGPCSPFRPSTPNPFSWVDALLADESRLLYLSSLVAATSPTKKSIAPIASGRQVLQSANYVVRVAFGTPSQTLFLAVDTSNDAAWIPCSSCLGCPATSSSPFASDTSTSFAGPVRCADSQCRQVPTGSPLCSPTGTCGFNMTYGGSTLEAALVRDTVTIAGDSFPGYTFGCLKKVTGTSVPPQGLLGLGRGPLSLLSQTNSKYSSTFSYCLPTFRSLNFSGSLRLGRVGQPLRIKTTPLLSNPRRPSLYYVNLLAIRVGRRVVDIPRSALAFDPVSGAGTVLDTGTMFTRLVEPAYVAVRDEFRRRVGGNVTTLGGFDTCYSGPVAAPAVTLLFAGMNVTLPPDNVMIHSTAGSTSCLAMAAAPVNVNGMLNVIANMQQQNHRVLIDVSNGRVGIAREACTAL